MYASEMISLSLYLGLLIGYFIPPGHKVWSLYKLLRKLLRILLLKNISLDQVKEFEDLLIEHHTVYLNFSKSSLKPKFHIALHYPEQIKCLGPPVHYWSMRFESKHQELKKIANSTNNRINIGYTIANRYLIANHNVSNNSQLLFQTSKLKNFTENFSAHSNCDGCELKKLNSNVKSAKYVKKFGTFYNVNDILEISPDLNELPVFARIMSIMINTTTFDTIFVMRAMKTNQFNEHYFAYEVEFIERTFCFKFSSIANFLHFRVFCSLPDGKKYVC